MAKRKIVLKEDDVVILKKSKLELTITGEVKTRFSREDFFVAKLNKGPFKGETFHIKVEEVEKKLPKKKKKAA